VRNDQKSPDKRSDLAIDAIAKGGDAGKIMSYLTGHKVSSFSFKFNGDPATPVERRAAKLAELRRNWPRPPQQKRLNGVLDEKDEPRRASRRATLTRCWSTILETDTVELLEPARQQFHAERSARPGRRLSNQERPVHRSGG